MKILSWLFFLATLVMTACSSSPPQRNNDGTPVTTPVMIVAPPAAATWEIAKFLMDSSGRTINSISGHVYCGEGAQQKPANHATVALMEKDKVLTTATSAMDGSYTLSHRSGFKDGYVFTVSAKCGKIRENLHTEVMKNFSAVDFWIK